ncbi:hypothetical protein ACB092_04G012200 [Castanea dentata]
METKADKVTLERVGRRIHFANLFFVPRVNSGGGLALYWKSDFAVDVQSFSNRHIDAFINQGMDDARRFTSFYRDPDTTSRENSWSLLRDLSRCSSLPWVCMGDFNEILFADEKMGWLERPERQMQSFRDALYYCRLKDLGFNGYPFTWCNRRPGDQNTWIPLDRGVATIDWILQFPTSLIHHLDAFHSDHKPLLLCFDSEFKRFYRKGKPFRFEEMWLKDSTCELVIKDSWGDQAVSESVWGFQQKIVACQLKLKEWDKKCFGYVHNSLQKKLKDLKEAEEGGSYSTNPRRICILREDIQRLKNREECMANQRNRRNVIAGLEDSEGANEVRLALDQMALLTAPGPDGISPIFYKSFWHIVGGDSINSTFIALIPKVKHPKRVADFRPISLFLVNRFKKFLASAIPETQNNVLVAFETLHYLKRKTNGKVGQMGLKLDMSKAYDRRMVTLIMSCFSTVSYSVLLNGQPIGEPLSPYPFLMCAMGLQSLLNKAEVDGHIWGVSICRNGPKVWERIQQVLGVPSICQFEKYLGLLALVGRAKKQSFIYIKERAGREVLIKSVIQAILTYTMDLEEHRKTHWVKWERLCEAKEVGGIGFKEIEKFNDALLAKQVWRLINNSGSLCHRVFKARDFSDCSILDANDSSSGSYAWKSIIGARDVIRKWMEDRWLPGRTNYSVISPLLSLAPEVKVSTLIDQNTAAWKTEEVQHMFLPHEADIILGIPLSARRPEDRIIWSYTPTGMFTTSSAFKMLVSCDVSPNAGGSNLEG